MKIIRARAPLVHTCKTCNSIYEVESGDVSCSVDILCGKVNDGAPDLTASWKCPVCGVPSGDWLYRLPAEWRADIKTRQL